MSQEHPPDRQETNLDTSEVVAALMALSEQAAQGGIRGFVISYVDDAGEHLCGSAGWHSRNPRAILVPAIQGLALLCGADPAPQARQEHSAMPHLLH